MTYGQQWVCQYWNWTVSTSMHNNEASPSTYTVCMPFWCSTKITVGTKGFLHHSCTKILCGHKSARQWLINPRSQRGLLYQVCLSVCRCVCRHLLWLYRGLWGFQTMRDWKIQCQFCSWNDCIREIWCENKQRTICIVTQVYLELIHLLCVLWRQKKSKCRA